jgi:hypothetical protein
VQWLAYFSVVWRGNNTNAHQTHISITKPEKVQSHKQQSSSRKTKMTTSTPNNRNDVHVYLSSNGCQWDVGNLVAPRRRRSSRLYPSCSITNDGNPCVTPTVHSTKMEEGALGAKREETDSEDFKLPALPVLAIFYRRQTSTMSGITMDFSDEIYDDDDDRSLDECEEECEMIEISPNVHLPLCGMMETTQAIETGDILPLSCEFCSTDICVISTQYVLCPICKCTSLLDNEAGRRCVAMGFIYDDLFGNEYRAIDEQ